VYSAWIRMGRSGVYCAQGIRLASGRHAARTESSDADIFKFAPPLMGDACTAWRIALCGEYFAARSPMV
jgi:hypothetical protein